MTTDTDAAAAADRAAQLAAHYAQCEQLVYENDRDAWLASLFAPQDRRSRLHALYAFARELSGVRAKVSQPMLGEMRLRWWIDALGGGEGARAHPVADALLDTIDASGISLAEVEDFIDAHAFELYDAPMETLAALESYCRRIGGRLGAWAAAALGAQDAAHPALENAGVARTLTAILTALPRQIAAGQTFLPATLLVKHGVAPQDLAAGADSPGLRALLAELRETARRRYETARAEARAASPQARAALLPASTVPLYLEPMERKSYTPFQPLAEPSQWRRQWRMWRASRGVGL